MHIVYPTKNDGAAAAVAPPSSSSDSEKHLLDSLTESRNRITELETKLSISQSKEKELETDLSTAIRHTVKYKKQQTEFVRTLEENQNLCTEIKQLKLQITELQKMLDEKENESDEEVEATFS